MNRSKLLLFAAALFVVAALGGMWLLGGSEPEGAAVAGPVAAGPAAPEAAGTPSGLDAGVPGDRTGGTELALGAAADARRTVRSGRRLAVTLALPPGAPADPELAVVAVAAASLEGRAPHELLAELRASRVEPSDAVRAEVSGARAELDLPEGLAAPKLLVDGRFLYLDEPVDVGAQEQLRLAPRLGAHLRVDLSAPGDAEPQGEIALMGGDFTGRAGWSRRTAQAAEAVEFRALAVDRTWSLSVDVEALHAWPELGIELEAGVEHAMEVELTPGATVAGVVVDDGGAPLAGIRVQAAGSGAGMWFGGGGRREVTGPDGRFELAALGPGEQQIETEAEGWVDAQSETFELADGERRDDLRLVLSRGLTIAGRVTRTDAGDAAGTEVAVETVSRGGGWGNWGGGRTRRAGSGEVEADGSFRVTGLEPGSYTVRASLEVGDDDATAIWRGVQESVAAGSADVALTLTGPIAFAGRVVDDRGEPIEAFEVTAEAVGRGGPEERQSFTSEDGTFVFARVGPGDWELTAAAEGHARSDAVALTLPGAGEGVELVLQRQATLRGTVFDATGAPAAGATVSADDGSGSGNPWARARGPRTETDAEGAFTLTGLTPGAQSLTAASERWADSEPAALELAPGEVREGVALALRVGGRIEGTVVTGEGDPQVGRRVSWGSNAMGFGSRGETRTDGAGRFAFDHVTPGEWAVSAAPDMAEMGERMRGRRDQTAFVEVMGELVTETVVVADGEVVEVALGGEPKRPVRLFGVVTRAGEAVPGAQVYAVSEGSAVFEGMKGATTDEDGSFELTVDRPGGYSLSANAGRGGVERMIDVPRADELRVDLPIPLGRIEGRVRVAGGDRAAGVRLSLQREDGLGRMRWAGNQATTNADGRYAFEDLEAGRYTVRANTGGWGGSSEAAWGSQVRDGVEVGPDETVSNVDFDLETSGTVRGLVRGPDGAPAAGVTVFFRDGAGRLVSSVSGTVTDAAGRFEERGLTPGTYSISARAEGLAASEAASVLVRSGETSETVLEVEVGTTLLVRLEEEGGDARRARVEVLDGDGREVGGLVTLSSLQSAFNQGASMREQRLGPLPPGRYTVRATAPDGRSKERRVSLRGRDEEKLVKLELDAGS